VTELTGRRALVTGGTRGIGAAVAARLVAAHASVTVTGRLPSGRAPDDCAYRGVDFSDRAGTAEFAGWAGSQEFDVLINNAGINVVSPFAEISDVDYDRMLDVNLRAPMALTRALIPGMTQRGWGRIVSITSIFGIVSKAGRAPYSASKFGLDGLSAALAAEVAARGVLVNCVAPGFVDTELTQRVLGAQGIADIVGLIPAGRLGRPEEIAELVAWLAGPTNSYVSGQNVVIDGGFVRT
jgi:3-oxoacyl-[acyl-carrier protein] reductase